MSTLLPSTALTVIRPTYGHMLENATATLNGTTYTFTRPKLAAETSGNGGTVVDTNETWAQLAFRVAR